MVYKDYREYWWLLTDNHHHLHFYGKGSEPSEHHTGSSTDVVDAKLGKSGLWLLTKTGSIYLVDWNKHRPNLANYICDKAYLNSLGVVFPGDLEDNAE